MIDDGLSPCSTVPPHAAGASVLQSSQGSRQERLMHGGSRNRCLAKAKGTISCNPNAHMYNSICIYIYMHAVT